MPTAIASRIWFYSPYERRYGDNSVTREEWGEFDSHKEYFRGRGSKLYHPYRQSNFDKPWWLTKEASFWVLGPAQHVATRETRELHDACLVIKATLGKRHCLFAGDASDMNLEYIAANTTHICDDILHASHHGSLEGANLSFIKKSNAVDTIVSTKSGVHENVPHTTALRRYRDHTRNKVHRTDQDETLRWTF